MAAASGGWSARAVRVLHDDLVRVEEHDVETADGRAFTFAMVRSPGFAKVVPLLPDGRVVLVRQYRYAVGAVTLELPAGAIDADEEPADAARRELGEEALLRTDRLTSLGRFHTSPGRMDELGWMFLAEDCRPFPEARPAEPTEPVTLDFEEALGLIGGDILDASSALALLLAHRRLHG